MFKVYLCLYARSHQESKQICQLRVSPSQIYQHSPGKGPHRERLRVCYDTKGLDMSAPALRYNCTHILCRQSSVCPTSIAYPLDLTHSGSQDPMKACLQCKPALAGCGHRLLVTQGPSLASSAAREKGGEGHRVTDGDKDTHGTTSPRSMGGELIIL